MEKGKNSVDSELFREWKNKNQSMLSAGKNFLNLKVSLSFREAVQSFYVSNKPSQALKWIDTFIQLFYF